MILVPALPLPVGEAHPFDPETVGLGTVPPGAEARIGRPAAQLAPRGRGCQEHQKRPRNRLGGGILGNCSEVDPKPSSKGKSAWALGSKMHFLTLTVTVILNSLCIN